METWGPIAAASLLVIAIALWVYLASRVEDSLDQIIEEIDRHKR